jgi:hypothetical protein
MNSRLLLLFGVIILMTLGAFVASAQVTVTLPNPSAGPNTSITIPVNVSSLTGQNVTSYEFVALCDTSFIQFDGIDVTGIISGGQGALANNHAGGYGPGNMKVVFATASPLSGSGVLVNLKATTKNRGGSTPIQLTGLVFNNGTPAFTLTNGSVTINAGLHPPTITPVSAKTVAEADTLRFTVIATDTNGLAMTYSSPNLPQGATLGSGTGQFVWRPDYTQAGSYTPRIKVSDTGGAADSIVVSITVTNVNRKPVFNPVSAKTVKDSDTLSVVLSAVDPDNDPLTYSFVSMTPSATTFASVSGNLLKWIPAFADTGKTYSLTVRVSDNIATGGGVVPGTDLLVVSVTVIRSRVRGDIDGYGTIQAADASIVLRHVAGIALITNPAALWAADASGDGTITAFDAALILQAAAGLITLSSRHLQQNELRSPDWKR